MFQADLGPDLSLPKLRRPGLNITMEHRGEQTIRFRMVVVYSLRAGPSVPSKQKRHREVLFTIRRRRFLVWSTIRFTRP